MGNQLIGKQEMVKSWGFAGSATFADCRDWVGTRRTPRGWTEVWRSLDPEVISFYSNDDTQRTADEVYHIDWSLHGFKGETV